MTTDDAFRLLSQAAGEGLSEYDFNPPSSTDDSVLEELLGEGHLTIVAVADPGTPEFTAYRLTLKGEALLTRLGEQRRRATPRGRLERSAAWLGTKVTTIVVSVLIAALTAWAVARFITS